MSSFWSFKNQFQALLSNCKYTGNINLNENLVDWLLQSWETCDNSPTLCWGKSRGQCLRIHQHNNACFASPCHACCAQARVELKPGFILKKPWMWDVGATMAHLSKTYFETWTTHTLVRSSPSPPRLIKAISLVCLELSGRVSVSVCVCSAT